VKIYALAAAAVLLAGCSKDIQNKEALRAGVIDYLSGRMSQTGLDPKLMDVDVSGMSFEQDQARATFVFRPKGSSEGNGMKVSYAFDRKGDHWVVRGRQDNGVNPHGAGGMPNPGDPGTTLPPGHVQIPGSGQGQLPPGHPSVAPKE
jgi:hypothetical protein